MAKKKPIAKVRLRNLETGEHVTDQYIAAPPEFVNPETGEIIATEAEWKAAIATLEERLSAIYGPLWKLRDGYAERFPPAVLPEKRYRSEKQEQVARCPRCGGRLEDSK